MKAVAFSHGFVGLWCLRVVLRFVYLSCIEDMPASVVKSLKMPCLLPLIRFDTPFASIKHLI